MTIDEYKVKQYYKEYQEFIGIELPQIKPVKIEKSNKALAYIDIDEINETCIPLYYTEDICRSHIQYIKSKFFHEFTHIQDGVKYYNKMERDMLCIVMGTYSEYHASKNETYNALGYKRYPRKIRQFDDKYKFYDQVGESENFHEYVLDALNNSIMALPEDENKYSQLDEVSYFMKFKYFISYTMYFLGKYNVYKDFYYKPQAFPFTIFHYFTKDIEFAYKMLLSQKGYDENYIGFDRWYKNIMKLYYDFYRHDLFSKIPE